MIEDYGYDKFGIKLETPQQPTVSGIGSANVDIANEPISPSELQDGQIESEVEMVRGHLQSSNFVSGDIGWQIKYDGTAEFQNVNIGQKIITIDTSADFQDTIDILEEEGGGILNLKPGTYTLNTSLEGIGNLSIIGESPATTIIDFNGTASSLSFLGTNIYTAGTITAITSGVFVTGSGTSWLANASVGQHLFIGTRWYLIAAVTSDTDIILAEGYGDSVTLPSTYRIATIKANVTLKNLRIKNSTGDGLVMTDCRKFILDTIEFVDNNVGIDIDNVSETNFDRVLSVSNTSDGIQMTNVGLCDWESVNCVSNGGNGITANNIKTILFLPIALNVNTGDGFNITTGADLNILIEASGNGGQGIELVSGCDNVVIYNALINGNTSDGIKLTATSDNTKVYGSKITSNGGYGVNIVASTDDNTIITSNDFAGNATSAVGDSGTNTVIRGNSGVNDNAASTANNVLAYGDGSDGDVIISADTNLTRDMYYQNLTVDSTFTLNPSGYRIFVSETLTNNGTIARNGNAGSVGTTDTAPTGGVGGVGGAALAAGTLPGSVAGVTGGNGGNGAVAGGSGVAGDPGLIGTAGNAQTNTLATTNGVAGVAGGHGGDDGSDAGGVGGAGGAGGASTQLSTTERPRDLVSARTFRNDAGTQYKPTAGSGASGGGGGGGAGAGGVAGGGGGGGGSGSVGGVMQIFAREVVNNGAITCTGGAGGAGGAGSDSESPSFNSGVGGGGGGGAGGNGGVLIINAGAFSGNTPTVAGGAGGTGGAIGAQGVQTNATAGTTGTTGATGTLIILS